MKTTVLITELIALCLQGVYAQSFTFNRCPGGHCDNDINMIIYAMDFSCNVIGESNPIAINSATTTYDYSVVSSTVGWATDPGPGSCGDWYFGAVKVYNCIVPAAPGAAGCGNGYDKHDFAICGTGTLNACFEYSSGCTDCHPGKVVDMTFTVNNDECRDSILDICD